MSRRLLLIATASLAVFAHGDVASQARPQSQGPTRSAGPKVPMAASIDPKLYAGLRYRMIGPMRGGRVTTVTGVPSQPTTFYMGVASGGVFKTTNNGLTWLPITDGQVPVGSTGSIAVSESNPDVIYLGTGSDGVRSNVSTGRGMYKSTDGGKTWSFVGLYNTGQIGAVRIHPTDPNTVWVSATGNIFGKNADRGVFKTTDGGRNWRKTLYINDSTGANDIEIQPGNPSVLYAAMGRLERKPWTIISGSREGGLYKSADGGETWRKMTSALPSELFGKANLAVTAANPRRIFALIEAKPGGGFYRSDDAGDTWQLVSSNANMLQRPFYYTTLGADPTNADVVYGGAEGFYKTADGGRTWTSMSTPHGDNHDIWISPRDGKIMIQANDGGANVSTDGGATWSTQSNQPTSEIYGVWLDNQYPYRLYGAQQDCCTNILASQPVPASEIPGNPPGCETGPIMPHPRDPKVVYGSCKGIYEYTNYHTGMSRQYQVGGESLYGMEPKDMLFRFQRVSPMETSNFDPEILYYGSQYVHRTRDKGVTWQRISPDLTAFDPCCQFPSGGPITRDNTGEEFYSTLYAIDESPLSASVIWTGANDGPFHVTRDNGKTWSKVTPKDLPPGGRVGFIDASPHRAGSAYFAVYRYLLGDYAPYIYRTDDYGATWKRLTDGKNGIAADNPTRVVREDPDREGLLYAGTEFGMYISFDNGGHWQPFDQNLATVPINDIKLHQGDLVVATQGRGLWIMDNVTPLQQVTPQVGSGGGTLYRPRPAWRVRPAATGGRGGGGGGGAGRGGRGANAAPAAPAIPGVTEPEYSPPGAMIDYYFVSAPTVPVTMEIRDAVGKVVRALSSESASAVAATPGAPTPPPDDPDAAMAANRPGGGRGRGGASAAPVRLPKNAGLNRFYWDMMHTNGRMVPAGNYTIKLTAGNWTATQPLVLKVDPRSASEGITAADLREQFDHNVRVADMIADATAVATRIQTARTRLRAASGAAAADSLAKINKIALKMFGPDEGVRYGVPGLRTHVSYVAGMTSSTVDQKVGREAIVRYGQMRKELDALKAELDKVLGPAR